MITGNVIAHKLFDNGVEQGDNVSCQLPSIEFITSTLKGAGVPGEIDMPVMGQTKSMVFSCSPRGINAKNADLASPGIHNLELRFVRDTITSSGSVVPQGSKIFMDGVNKKYDPGKVENGASMDGSIDFEVLRYRQVIDGVETLLIDKINYIHKVNGVDYMKQIKSAL